MDRVVIDEQAVARALNVLGSPLARTLEGFAEAVVQPDAVEALSVQSHWTYENRKTRWTHNPPRRENPEARGVPLKRTGTLLESVHVHEAELDELGLVVPVTAKATSADGFDYYEALRRRGYYFVDPDDPHYTWFER